jgi:hypothetical protein
MPFFLMDPKAEPDEAASLAIHCWLVEDVSCDRSTVLYCSVSWECLVALCTPPTGWMACPQEQQQQEEEEQGGHVPTVHI